MPDKTFQTLVCVAECTNRVDAQLKQAALVDAGLRARLASDDAGGLHPQMGFAYRGAHRIMVPDSEQSEAAQLITELDRGDHQLAADDAPAPRRQGSLAVTVIAVLIVAFVTFQLLVHDVDIAGF